MVDDTGAAGGPRGHGGPGLGGPSNFCRGFSSSLKGRGRGRGCGCGPGRGACGGTAKDKEWIPVTKLGRLVKDMKIKSLEEIYLFSLPIPALGRQRQADLREFKARLVYKASSRKGTKLHRETLSQKTKSKKSDIIDFFLGASLKDEVLKIMPVQKQTWTGHQTKFKAFVTIGNYNGHVGLGVKYSKEVATAIKGPSSWPSRPLSLCGEATGGNKIGKLHTVPCKVTGRCGSVLVRLIPDPRRTGIVSAPVPKKLLMMPGIDDCYHISQGCTATLGNFAKATFNAISKTYRYLTSDLWKETVFTKSPYQEFTDHLVKTHTSVSVQRNQVPAVAII